MDGNSDEIKRLHVIVEGHVQGVGFRYFTVDQARRLGLSGWVRNLPSGAVEAEAEGPREDLLAFLEALAEGPAGSAVRRVRPEWLPASGEDFSFRVRIYD
ncbi:MAG TPA: acylphosphatase [Anaerolineaceae bacterium]|nr:acylphosphatase [Chloroflexota bacterium]HOA22109.1 acylphosphatase [Anaerolineaceae bacterium]HOG77800.1 acylphosphatase [Anaerolineaceae bacterium]